jgi:PPM family protein phosphatase
MIITAGASLTNKEENQDCYSSIENPKLQLNGVVVADGLGSFFLAKEASDFVTQFVKQKIEALEKIDDLNFENIFKEAKNELINYAISKEIVLNKATLGTTLIIAVHYQTPEQTYGNIKIAYVGNGAIWHLRGNFNQFNESQLLPWNSLNYLNPHSIQEEGKEALYKLISVSDNFGEAIPTVLTIRTDENFGDIIMICTDGIYSYDQIQIGKDNNGRTWISGEKSMTSFYASLDDYFKLKEDNLNQSLQTYLSKHNEIEPFDDDATLALLITSKAISHQAKLQNENN